jgi:TonB family protein
MADRSYCSGRLSRGFKGALVTLTLLVCFIPGSVSRVVAQDASAPRPKRKLVVRVEPEYPYILRNGHFEGQVRLQATVLPNGSVSKVESKGGNPMLSQYASEAVMRWKYAPGPNQTIEEAVFIFHPSQQ